MPVHYETVRQHIVVITIDRPEKRNALDLQHWHELAGAWKRYRDDLDAWVAIITGVDTSFCVGGDLKTFIPLLLDLQRQQVDEHDGIPLSVAAEGVLRDLAIYKPIIAAINGPCMAGGMEMLGGTDIRIASVDATFSVTEPRMGLIAGGGTTARLPRQLAWPAAMEILLTADTFSAERARELGLVNEVVPHAELLERALGWADRVIRNAPLAVAATKQSALRGWQAGSLAEAFAIEQECVDLVRDTEDAREGPRAFVEKRDPIWLGR